MFLSLAAAAMLAAVNAQAQDNAGGIFDKYLSNRTLRIDYIFAGDATSQEIYLDEMSLSEGWAGRRVNLDKVPVAGNGCITLRDSASNTVLYKLTFSTLFQEWQTTEEATMVKKSFENVYLLPMPTNAATVTVDLFSHRGVKCASLTHAVKPDDILIRKMTPKPAPHKYILQSGSTEECIDIAIVAEGYTAREAKLFYKDARATVDALLSHEPFAKYRDRLNFVAVALPSEESGVTVPLENDWKRTPLSSGFSTFYMDRYLTTLRLKDLADRLQGIAYEHIIILANTDTYGGGGIYNSYTLTTAHHSGFRQVVVHEFGHSFAGLADEYYYDDMYSPYYFPDVEPWEQNITTMADFDSKWADMMPANAPKDADGHYLPTPPVKDAELWKSIAEGADTDAIVGVYEGGGYLSKGVFRPYPDCRMKSNIGSMFCPVCQRAIERMILYHVEEAK